MRTIEYKKLIFFFHTKKSINNPTKMNIETVFTNIEQVQPITEEEQMPPYIPWEIGASLLQDQLEQPTMMEEQVEEEPDFDLLPPILERQLTLHSADKYAKTLYHDNPDAVYRAFSPECLEPGYVEDTTLYGSETDISLWVCTDYKYKTNTKQIFEITRHSQRKTSRYEKIDTNREFGEAIPLDEAFTKYGGLLRHCAF